MNPEDNKLTELRRRAEERLRVQLHSQDPLKIPPQELPRLIYDLQVHQIELEMQNDELRRAQEELSDMRDWFYDLYNFTPVGYITLNAKNLIVEANLAVTEMLDIDRSQLINQQFIALVALDGQDVCYKSFRKLKQTAGRDTVDVKMGKRGGHCFLGQTGSSVYRRSGRKCHRITCSTDRHQ